MNRKKPKCSKCLAQTPLAQRSGEQLMQLAVDGIIARDNLPPLDRLIAAAKIRDEAACFTHHQDAGCDIPGLQAALPEAVIAARRDMSEVERGGAETADACDGRRHRAEDSGPLGKVAMAHKGDSG